MLKYVCVIYIIICKYNRTELTKFMCRMCWLIHHLGNRLVLLFMFPSAKSLVQSSVSCFHFDDWTVALHIFMSRLGNMTIWLRTPTSSMTSAFASTWLPGAEGTGRTEGTRNFWVPVPGSHDQWLYIRRIIRLYHWGVYIYIYMIVNDSKLYINDCYLYMFAFQFQPCTKKNRIRWNRWGPKNVEISIGFDHFHVRLMAVQSA